MRMLFVAALLLTLYTNYEFELQSPSRVHGFSGKPLAMSKNFSLLTILAGIQEISKLFSNFKAFFANLRDCTEYTSALKRRFSAYFSIKHSA